MNVSSPWNGTRILLIIILSVSSLTELSGQSGEYIYFYRVYFHDKGTYVTDNFQASDLLSEKALLRRTRSGIACPLYSDLPVYRDYINQISSLGYTLHCTSKWMNTALFKTTGEMDTSQLMDLPFVSEVRMVKNNQTGKGYRDKLEIESAISSQSAYDLPITMLNGSLLHSAGWDGSGVLIAVLDGGFAYADIASSLENLRDRNGIKYYYNFVHRDMNVFSYHNHGTAVLSVLAGLTENMIKGTAPDADYMLLITEDVSSEFPVEEDYWVAGAEFADSSGADIISSSLGYRTFNDPSMNYKFQDMDGNTAFITRAADIAASKGILVVASAGNERDKEWIRIIAPSDGDSVIAVGAVNEFRTISSFSSAGPSADGRVKPDVAALGVNIIVQLSPTSLSYSGGTSFSCPVISGMAACLKEAIPEATNIEIMKAIQSSSDRFTEPDSLYGYGIPDMVKALTTMLLQDNKDLNEDVLISFGPNPTAGEVKFSFASPPGEILVEIITPAGQIIYSKNYGKYYGRDLSITALENRLQGLYFIRLTTDKTIKTFKIIKVAD